MNDQPDLFRAPKPRRPSTPARILELFDAGLRLHAEGAALLTGKPLTTIRPELSKLRAAGKLEPCGKIGRELVWKGTERLVFHRPRQIDAFEGATK